MKAYKVEFEIERLQFLQADLSQTNGEGTFQHTERPHGQ